jgi:hypothetical protein
MGRDMEEFHLEIEQLEEDPARKCRILERTVERNCEGEGFRRNVPYLEKNKPKITKVAVLILASFVFNSSIDESSQNVRKGTSTSCCAYFKHVIFLNENLGRTLGARTLHYTDVFYMTLEYF